MPTDQLERKQLVDGIDTQVEQWAKLIEASHHPSLQHFSITHTIIADCTPAKEAPEEIVAKLRFTRHMTRQEANDQLEKEQRVQKLATLLQHVETDTLAIEDSAASNAFTIAESFSLQYMTPPGYDLALHYLKRLYTLREYSTANPMTYRTKRSDTSANFSYVLRSLIDEI